MELRRNYGIQGLQNSSLEISDLSANDSLAPFNFFEPPQHLMDLINAESDGTKNVSRKHIYKITSFEAIELIMKTCKQKVSVSKENSGLQ